jgi:uncharacterized protein
MVLWNGINFTADGREPATAEEFHQIGLSCWNGGQYRAAAPFFLETAAVNGHAAAAEFLGHVWFVQQDYAKAVPWLRQSPGSSRAAYYLGCLYQRGCPEAGIGQSFDDAAEWYRHAVSLGQPEAMLALGDLYLERLLPVSRAPMAHALEYFLMASQQGHPYGQFRAAEVYRTLYNDLDRAAMFYEYCLANPARQHHALNTLMTLQSQAALGQINSTRASRSLQLRRDTVNPSPPSNPSY